MSQNTALQIVKLRAALTEVFAQRSLFSDETYTQVVLALYDRLRILQTYSGEYSPPPTVEYDEIRLVTVMFIDVMDSTEIVSKQRVDAEDWKKIIRDAHSRLRSVLHSWDGEVGQYLGDGLLCFFGVHRSREDDTARAVYCALACQEAMAEYAVRIRERYGIDFAVRIGMSTGRVVVGVMGDEDKKEILTVGTPTNLASRLQGMCEPGKVLIDAPTNQRVQDHFILQARPVAQIKGFEAPVESFVVLGRQRSSQLSLNRILGIQTPFVGREGELRSLREIVQRAQETKSFQVVTIYGDVGLGKSRLLQEAMVDMPFTHVAMSGNFIRQHNSYNLIHDLLARLCELKDDTPSEVAEQRIVQKICENWSHPDAEATAHMMGFLAGYGFKESQHVRAFKFGRTRKKQIAYAWVAKWFQSMAQRNGLLIAIDNLQWADIESLGLLEYLVEVLAHQSGILIGTARPEFFEHDAGYMSNVDRRVIVSIESLDEASITQMIDAILEQVENVPPQLPALMSERAQGNPLFVEEFFHMLLDNNIFEPTGDGRWKVNRFLYATLTSRLLPNSLLALLQARLDELSTTTRRVVQVAAVIGQTFWKNVTMQIADLETVQLELADLEHRGIVVQEGSSSFENDEEFTFRHTLYREVAYSMLTRPNREAYHRQIAAWLSSQVKDRPDYVGMLAHHFAQGGQHRESLNAYLMAAEESIQRGLMREVLQMVESGLAAAREVQREVALPRASKLWLLQGQALDSLDRFEEASAASQTALMLMEEIPLNELVEERVIAARTLGSALLSLGRFDEAFQALRNAHSLLPKENIGQHAAVLRTFGTLFRYRGQLNESLAYQQQAVNLAQESGDSREIAQTMAMMGLVTLDKGDFATALTYSERVLAMNRQDGNLYYQILDLSNMASIYHCLFDYETALALCDEAGALESLIHYNDPLARINRGLSLIALGQKEDGLKLLQEIASANYQSVSTRWRVQLALVMGLALVEEYEYCQQAATTLIVDTRERNPIFHGRGLLWLGIAQHTLQNRQQAQITLREALEKELHFGGRDAWLCYYALGSAIEDPAESRNYLQHALHVLQAISTSLYSRPQLQTIILENPTTIWLAESLRNTN
jgi:class 3 adenylate cyclase/tetratricopeptide (TPR) repeat protein